MVSLFNGIIPIVGKDQYGNPINMVVNRDNAKIVQARNVQSIGASETTQNPTQNPVHSYPNQNVKIVEIKSLYSKNGITLALGNSTIEGKGDLNLAYTTVTGNWVCGLSPVVTMPGPYGVTYSGNCFVVATSAKTVVSDFKYSANSPTSTGIVQTLPKIKQAALGGVSVDSLSASNDTIVATSKTMYGTWITKATLPVDEWGRHVGEAELILTKQRSTSYTFPGYAKANPQIQRVCALPNGDKPPVDWTTGDDRTNGYYGVIGGPSITVSWVKTA